jgi:transposase
MGSRAGDRPWLWQWPSLRMMELGNGVRLGLLQASLGDDHGALCRYRRVIGKREPVRCRRDRAARGIAQLMRLGWFRPVHCKSLPAQEVRALLTARKLLQTKNHDVEMSLRGVLRGFGLKVGPTTPRTFPGRIRELVAGHTTLSTVADALLAARSTLFEQLQKLEKRLRSLAREDGRVRLLMTAPGVGTIVALTYASAIDDPARFRSSKSVGAHFGLTPKKYQSGEPLCRLIEQQQPRVLESWRGQDHTVRRLP